MCVDENVDPANRFRLSKKYCGIHLRSTSDSNEVVQLDDRLVVVDLEWRTDRAREYANKKGSVLVCDLRTHFSFSTPQLRKQEKVKARSLFAYIINETFFNCIQAPTRLNTRPLKMRPAAGIRGGGSGMIRELPWGGSSSLSLSLYLTLLKYFEI